MHVTMPLIESRLGREMEMCGNEMEMPVERVNNAEWNARVREHLHDPHTRTSRDAPLPLQGPLRT